MDEQKRQAALEWWRGLPEAEQRQVHERSAQAHWTFEMFSASTRAITQAFQ